MPCWEFAFLEIYSAMQDCRYVLTELGVKEVVCAWLEATDLTSARLIA